MSLLFEECQIALGKDCQIIENKEEELLVLKQLDGYLTPYNTVDWQYLRTQEYNDLEKFKKNHLMSVDVYVVADSNDVPVFKSRLDTILSHLDDVTALSCKVFIFNQDFIVQEQFPYRIIKMGYKVF